MGIYKDQEIGDRGREGKGGRKESPGIGVGIEDDSQEGNRWFCPNSQSFVVQC